MQNLFATRKSSSQIDAYENVLSILILHGLTPKLLTMDSEVFKLLVNFLDNDDISVQLVHQHLHRCNATERAVQTFKTHFIAILCGAYQHLSIHL